MAKAKRSSSASTKAPAPEPLTSRTNELNVTAAKNWRKASGIPRNPFRRLSNKKNRKQEDEERPSLPDVAPADEFVARPSPLTDVEDDDDVQYIDLDNVVTASPGAVEATSEDLIEAEGRPTDDDNNNNSSVHDDGENGSFMRCDDDDDDGWFAPLSEEDWTDPVSGDETVTPGDGISTTSSPPRTTRSCRDDEASCGGGEEPSSPPGSPSAIVYHLPDSLSKRRRGSPRRRIPWKEERSPSPPIDGRESVEWARVRALESTQHQVVAYWNLLYPDQPQTEAPLTTSSEDRATLKSCLKRSRRASNDEEKSFVPQKVLQWGSNSAVEFTGQMTASDFHHLSPATVDLQFPSSLELYDERHPVDEELTQVTKDNSAILASWDGMDDDSSSESSFDSNDSGHCFEDDDEDDDEEDYRPVRRQSSSERRSRRASGFFSPAHVLEASTDAPMPSSSLLVDLSPLDNLTLASPSRHSSPPHQLSEEHDPGHREPDNSVSSSTLSTLPVQPESVKSPPAPLMVETNGLIGPRSSSSWQQKLLQVCLSPVSSMVGMGLVHSLEMIVSKLTQLDRTDLQGFHEAFPAAESFDWLEPFESSPSLRKLVDRSFLLARGALSILPPANHVTYVDDDIEALAQAEWIEIEIKVLEAMVFQLAAGPMRDLSTQCDCNVEKLLNQGSAAWIRARAIREEQEITTQGAELLALEFQYEQLKQLRVQMEFSSVVWGRYSSQLLQSISPFALVDTDGVESHLVFPTPVQGYDIIGIHKMDQSLIFNIASDRGPASASNGVDTRFDPLHPCAQFYVSLLEACIPRLNQIGTEDDSGSLFALELLLGRLESAFWDVLQFCDEVGNATVYSYAYEGSAIVVISATTATNAMINFFYDSSDVRTLSSCRPTLAQLEVPPNLYELSRRYPEEPLFNVFKSLLEELEAQIS